MIRLYTEIAQRISTLVPNAGFIDLYKGQLENPEEFDTLTPSVLIDLPQTDWEQVLRQNQIGDGSLTVRYVSILPSRTHAHDPNISMSVEALSVADDIHEAVKKHPDVIRRTRTRRYHAFRVSTNAYVVEQQYIIRERYETPVETTPKRDPQIGLSLILPSHLNQQ